MHNMQDKQTSIQCYCILSINITFTAPSAPPSSVMVTGVTTTTVTVQWGPVEPCADQNGAITGYSVRYGSETVYVSGDSSGGMTTITDLTPSTTYSIQVAAETSAGTGVYSSAVDQMTKGVCVYCLRLHITFSVSLSLCSSCDSRLHNSHHHLSLLDQWGLRGCQL